MIARFLRDEGGGGSIQNVLYILIFLIFGGYAVDVANAYRLRAVLQATADSAALGGARDLPSTVDATETALALVIENMPPEENGTVATAQDVVFGYVDGDTGVFVPGGAPGNVMDITVRRAEDRGNGIATFLLKLVGIGHWDFYARARASFDRACTGIVAGEIVSIDKDAWLGSGFCAYGRDGVIIDKDGVVEPGAYVGTLPPLDLTLGTNTEVDEGSKFVADLWPVRAEAVSSIIDDWERYGRPGYQVEVHKKDLPDSLQPHTIYIVDANLNVRKNYYTQDVIIAVRGHVNMGKDGVIENTGDCMSPGHTIGLFAEGNINLGKDTRLIGADVVSGSTIVVDKDVIAVQALMEAVTDVRIKKDPGMGYCLPIDVSGPGRTRLLR